MINLSNLTTSRGSSNPPIKLPVREISPEMSKLVTPLSPLPSTNPLIKELLMKSSPDLIFMSFPLVSRVNLDCPIETTWLLTIFIESLKSRFTEPEIPFLSSIIAI